MSDHSNKTKVKNMSIIWTLATLLVLSGVTAMLSPAQLSPAQQLAFADEGEDKKEDKKDHKKEDKKDPKSKDDHDKKKKDSSDSHDKKKKKDHDSHDKKK